MGEAPNETMTDKENKKLHHVILDHLNGQQGKRHGEMSCLHFILNILQPHHHNMKERIMELIKLLMNERMNEMIIQSPINKQITRNSQLMNESRLTVGGDCQRFNDVDKHGFSFRIVHLFSVNYNSNITVSLS